jgi:hypothetical protein
MAQRHHWTQQKSLVLKKLANDMGFKWSIGLPDPWNSADRYLLLLLFVLLTILF